MNLIGELHSTLDRSLVNDDTIKNFQEYFSVLHRLDIS